MIAGLAVAASDHDDVHLYTDLECLDREGVVVDILDLAACQLHDDVL